MCRTKGVLIRSIAHRNYKHPLLRFLGRSQKLIVVEFMGTTAFTGATLRRQFAGPPSARGATLYSGEPRKFYWQVESSMRNRLLIVICFLLVGAASSAFATDFAVVVNPTNPIRGLTLVDLGKIFKAKTNAWPGGKSITIVLRDPGTPAGKFVIEKVLGGTVDDGKAVLNDASRKSIVPVVFAESDDEVLKIVEGNAGAVGVIDVYNITGGVKVVKIDDKQPFDPGYALKGR